MVSQLAFGAGTFCIGFSFAIALFVTLVDRHTPINEAEGCFTKLIYLSVFIVGLAFFWIGLISAPT